MTDHTPRSAVALLTDALSRLDAVEPPGAREPVRQIFRAAIEQCIGARSLLGKPVVYVLALAQSVVDAGRAEAL